MDVLIVGAGFAGLYMLYRARRAGLTAGESVPVMGAVKVLVRNVFFLAVVFTHGLRRLLPPY